MKGGLGAVSWRESLTCSEATGGWSRDGPLSMRKSVGRAPAVRLVAVSVDCSGLR